MRSPHRLVVGVCLLVVLAGVGIRAVEAANPDGALRIVINSAPNFVVDSNVESPSTYAPRAAYLGAVVYNDGATDMHDVFINIGNYIDGSSDTPGTYPSRAHMALVGPLPGNEFALTHEGGSAGAADAVRYLGTIPAGGSMAVYWLVSYPNLDENGDAVHGPSVKPDDDLWLEYDVWATATQGGSPLAANVTEKVTMRNEISASANKIWPNVISGVPQSEQDLFGVYEPTWQNLGLAGVPGTTITSAGYWFRLGNVSGGFDNDGDLVPDQNAWLQPVGDPSMFDSSAYRLVRTYARIYINGGEKILEYEDNLFLDNLPPNQNVSGMVYYEFMPLLSGASSVLTPYQEAASGFDNEKFNGDYGTSIMLPPAPETELLMEKTVDKTTAWPGDPLWYEVTYTNAGEVAVGSPELHTPLVIQDAIPAGTVYVAGSAAISNTLPTGVSAYTILYSTNHGVSWTTTEPATAADVTDLQWWLSDAFDPATDGKVTFSVTVDNPYAEPSQVVLNVAGLSFGNTAPFLEDDAATLILGLNAIGDTVFLDNGAGGGIAGNGLQDGTETGIADITVDLYLDVNTNGLLDAGDVLVGTTVTDGSGLYGFANLPDGMYLVEVDDQDPNLPMGSAVTTPTLVSVDLDSAGANADAVSYLDADFGFAPVLALTKTIIGSATNREGDEVSYEIVVTNSFAGNAGLEDFTLWATSVDDTHSGTGNKGYLNPTNAFGLPDGLYAVGSFDNATEQLAVTGYTTTNGIGNIIKVRLECPVTITGTFGATESLDITLFDGATTLWTTNYLCSNLSNRTLTFDISSIKAWAWSDFAPGNTLSIQFSNLKQANNTGVLYWDSAAMYVSSDWVSPFNDPSLTLEPVPLVDTYDADKMEFVSAFPEPDSVVVSGSAPNSIGTLTWNSIGPIYPGDHSTVTATFKMLEPPNNTTATNTNTVVVTEAYYADGRPANTATAAVENVVLPGGTIGDFVWRDLDADGIQDGGDETGIARVSVRLTPPAGVDLGNGAGNPITNITDATGYYLFEGLPADGNYTVTVLTATLPGGSGTCTYDEDDGTVSPDGSTIVTMNFDATDGSDTHLTADFGYTVGSAIDGTVWNDLNRGGESAPDTAEPWLAGVTVYLFAGTSPGTPGEAIATTTTDANGYFIFSGAYAGDYTVQVAANTGDMSSGTWVQSFDTDGTSSAHYVVTNLVSGGYARADYSYYQTGSYAIGDTLFYDWNTNGVQDANDEGVPNVTVDLYLDVNGNGVIDWGTDARIGSDVTDTNGNYRFESRIPASYIVIIDQDDPDMPPVYTITADPDSPNDGQSSLTITNASNLDQDWGIHAAGHGSIGDKVWKDVSGDGIQSGPNEPGIANITVNLYTDWDGDGTEELQATTVTDANGWYEFGDLPDGTYIVRVDAEDADMPTDIYGHDYAATTPVAYTVQIANGDHYYDADFGFTPLGSIGDMIFWDANRDGEQDPGEAPIPGVTVKLYIDTNSDGYYDAGDTLYGTTNTTAEGYVFHGLPPNDYVVVVDTASTPIAGMQLSADPSWQGYAGDPEAVDADSEYGVTLLTGTRFYGADFGYVPDGVIGDTVWLDMNGDGVRDPDEAGIAYITVNLYTNGSLMATTETDAGGWYIFQNLPDDTYTVVVDTSDTDFPASLSQTYDADGTLDDQATAVVLSSGQMVSVDGIAFTNELGIDFGYRYAGSNVLSGTIGLDAVPYDGVMGTGTSGVGPGESPFPGETVYIYLWNDDGDSLLESGEYVYLSSTVTDSNGDYAFTDLPDGGVNAYYIVSYAPTIRDLLMTTTNGCTPATIVSNTTDTAGNTQSAWQAVPVAADITNMDFAFQSTLAYDFGDLPAVYGTLLADNGARHIVADPPTLYLGTTVDTENDGVPSVNADGDGADEDGVSLAGNWIEGTNGGSVAVTVGAGSGWLVGFMDFNNDGDFTDAGEMVVSAAVSAGAHTFAFDVPAGTIAATNVTRLYSRFRLFATEPSYPAASSVGVADNGEVEDYVFTLGCVGDRVWKDQDNDGVQDAGEPPLAGVLVFADLDDDGIHDPGEPSATTDANGVYGIGGFATGTTAIRVDPSTLPATLWPSYDLDGTNTPHVTYVSLQAGDVRTDVDFGYFPGYIDVGVLKTVDDAPDGSTNVYTTAGSNMVFTMTVTNYGPLVATELQFTDNLPTSLTYVTHWTSTGTYDNVSGIWDIGTLAVDGTATMTITAVASTNLHGQSITNWVYLTNLYQEDTNPDNNQDDAVIKPTAVVLSRFEALTVDGQVVIAWETASEVGTIGFFLMREDEDGSVQVNAELLPSIPDSPQGGIYSLSDPDAAIGRRYTYRLIEVEASGARNAYGPFDVVAPAGRGGPTRNNAGGNGRPPTPPRGLEKATAMDFGNMRAEAKRSASSEQRAGRRRALGHARQARKPGHPHYAGGPVMKVVTEEAGVIAVTADQFIAATGADTNAVMALFQNGELALSCNGVKVPYVLNAEKTELRFYAETIDSQYTDRNAYILQGGRGLRMTVLEGQAPEFGAPATYLEQAHFEQDIYSVGALIKDPDADYMMWSFFIGGNATYGRQTYTLAAPGGADGTATLVVRMQGGSSTGVAGEHIITVVVNGTTVGSGSWTGTTAFDLEVSIPGGLLIDGDNAVVLIASKGVGAAYSVTYLNEFDLTYPRKLEAANDRALIRHAEAGVLTVGGFTSPSPSVWDIVNPAAPVILNGVNAADGRVSFLAEAAHDYLIVGENGLQTNRVMEAIQLGVLKSATNRADYLIITVPELAAGAQKLADYRSGLGLNVTTAMLDDIYNEFSYGIATPVAIRDFLAYAHRQWRLRPNYVVLAGSGSVDYKGTQGYSDCLLPPMLLKTPQGLFASDNWFVDFNDDRVPEIAIGRLPVITDEELTDVVDKIIAYEAAAAGDWQNRILAVADNRDDGGNFPGASDRVLNHTPASYPVTKAYLDEASLAETRAALLGSLNAGAAFMSYFGHSGLDRLANEGLLTSADVAQLTNAGKPTVLTAMSCLTGRFELPGYDTIGEELLLRKEGGAIAIWAPSGMALNPLSRLLAEQFYAAVFDGQQGVLGDAIVTAMRGYAVQTAATAPLSVFVLLGDPALRLTGRPDATYTVELSSFERWQRKWYPPFAADNRPRPLPRTGPLEDANGNGIANILEYAHGFNPLRPDNHAGLRLGQLAGNPSASARPYDIEVVYQRNKYAGDVTLILETSEDLMQWRRDNYHVTETIITDDEDGLTQTVRARIKFHGRNRGFARLRLEME